MLHPSAIHVAASGEPSPSSNDERSTPGVDGHAHHDNEANTEVDQRQDDFAGLASGNNGGRQPASQVWCYAQHWCCVGTRA